MIQHEYNAGWGNEWATKQFENELLDKLYVHHNDVAVVNSVWYNKEYHKSVLADIKQKNYSMVAVSAMLDYSIPDLDWFDSLDIPVHFVGYYPGKHMIDYWALFINQYFTEYTREDIVSPIIDRAFMCMNRKPHWHRKQLFGWLQHYGIVDGQLVSMGTDNGVALHTLPDDDNQSNLAPNGGKQQNGIGNDIASLGNLHNWRRHLVNIVSETVYDIEKHQFVSEKIYKPIIGCKPFLIYANGANKWLHDRGFETYENDFKDLTDIDLNVTANIPPFLKILDAAGPNYWQMKHKQLREKTFRNQQNFTNYIQQQKIILNSGF
jgi:hypothetical protein